jgi:hypothetical protein
VTTRSLSAVAVATPRYRLKEYSDMPSSRRDFNMKQPRKSSDIAKTINALSDQARQAAEQTPDLLAELSVLIKTTMHSDADPYLLMGVLLEGIVQTLTLRIPPERQPDTELATLLMLKQRNTVIASVANCQ